MARCEDCIHDKVCVIKAFPDAFENTQWEKEPCDHFKNADVAPKSEVDRLVDKWIGSGELTPDEKTLRLIEQLRDEAKRYERYYFNHEYDKLIADAKAEAAREIFEEIENKKRFLKDCAGNMGVVVILKDIAELKKKYTEGNR